MRPSFLGLDSRSEASSSTGPASDCLLDFCAERSRRAAICPYETSATPRRCSIRLKGLAAESLASRSPSSQEARPRLSQEASTVGQRDASRCASLRTRFAARLAKSGRTSPIRYRDAANGKETRLADQERPLQPARPVARPLVSRSRRPLAHRTRLACPVRSPTSRSPCSVSDPQ
jgi:hypothetical protein